MTTSGQISRRGFLQVMTAVAVGMTATFDTESLLWLPIQPDAAVPIIVPTTTSFTRAVIDEQLELNDLALQFATQMGERLHRHQSLVLNHVMLRHAGHVRIVSREAVEDRHPARMVTLAPGLIELDTGVRGYFEPFPARVMKAFEFSGVPSKRQPFLDMAAGQMSHAVMYNRRINCFAPISAELRAGVAHVDTVIGIATDPQSGLSGRALRWRQVDGTIMTGVELAVGSWERPVGRKASVYIDDDWAGDYVFDEEDDANSFEPVEDEEGYVRTRRL